MEKHMVKSINKGIAIGLRIFLFQTDCLLSRVAQCRLTVDRTFETSSVL